MATLSYHGPWNLLARPRPWVCSLHGPVEGDWCEACKGEAAEHKRACGPSMSCPHWQVMIADPSLGACRRMREGCGELGPWRPFYQGYVCEECLRADQEDVRARRSPPGDMRIGTLFKRGE